jgi:hypothetical protein
MKKIILFMMALLVAFSITEAAELNQNDTTVHFNKKIIHVQDSIGQVKVKVFEATSKDSIPYKVVYEGQFAEEKTFEKWTVVEEIGLQIPFLGKSNERHQGKMEPHWAGIGWGFANISDASFKINNIDGVSLKSGSSSEFFVNLIEKILPIYKNRLGITTGLGFNWRTYSLDYNTHFVNNNGLTDVYDAPVGVKYEYSKLKTAHITLPVLLEWQPGGLDDDFFVSVGVICGVKTYSVSKIKFKNESGDMIKRVEDKGLNVSPLSLDYYAQIGYGSFNVFAKYSPFSIFESGKGPDVRAISLGLLLNF